MRLFADASIAKPDTLDPWIKHTIHAFDAALDIHPQLQCTYVFREAPKTVEIDIIRDKPAESNIPHFQFHHRWLDYDHVHSRRDTCLLFQSKSEKENQDVDAICYCAVEALVELILSEIQELTADERTQIGHRYRDYLSTIPRNVRAVSTEDDYGMIRTELNWTISAASYFGSFDVSIFPESYGNVPRKEHRFYHVSTRISVPESSNDQVTEDPPVVTTSCDTVQPPAESPTTSSSHSSPMPFLETSPRESVADVLWHGTAEHSSNLVLDTQLLAPGKRYVALIRLTQEKGCFYCAPFAFEIPCTSPQKLEVKKMGSKITVTWDYPFAASTTKFQIKCESPYDTHYTSEFITGRTHSFEVDLEALTSELDVIVQAESEDGVRSENKVVKVPAESMTATSPSVESISDDNGLSRSVSHSQRTSLTTCYQTRGLQRTGRSSSWATRRRIALPGPCFVHERSSRASSEDADEPGRMGDNEDADMNNDETDFSTCKEHFYDALDGVVDDVGDTFPAGCLPSVLEKAPTTPTNGVVHDSPDNEVI